VIFQVERDLQRMVAFAGITSPEWSIPARMRAGSPRPGTVLEWVVTNRTLLHVPDIEQEERFPRARDLARTMGYRSVLGVPILRDGDPVGVILLNRTEPFTEAQIQLLQTFADQAVIAIENARLLTELQARTGELTRSVDQLTALGEVGRAVSSTLDLETVLATIVSRAVEISGWTGAWSSSTTRVPRSSCIEPRPSREPPWPRPGAPRGSGRAKACWDARRSPSSRSRWRTSPPRAPTRAGCATT
jgi:GAF domain-containing protein